ncbi:MAG: Spy/CpxP family protein refolding chaperone [Rhizobiales bacterium]|nr:Spy/CpxP family protein refolding chaperone [Hyphomicrobiales bacterium]
MRKSIIAAIAAVAVIGSTAVYAQHRFHHPRMSAEDRAAFVDAKIASVHAGLKLTPDQEKNWPAVETAVRDFAKQRIDRANARAAERDLRRAERNQKGSGDRTPDQAGTAPNFDPVARLRERADNMASTATGLKRIADAADPLYKSLNDGQKRRLAMLTRMGGPRGWHHHEFGPGRDDGPGRERGPNGPERL